MKNRAHSDDRWMARALELARHGIALTSPNPMVGAVLVKDGRMVGIGYHTYDERKHAEIHALEGAGRAARGATLYVNLEPCSHTGRTGPCTEAIIAAGVRRVVAAMADPNPRVSGRGFRRLRRAGIRVDVGLREAEARRLNEHFARWIRSGLPFVTLKSAMTLDGKIAGPPTLRRRSSITWITSKESRAEVQRMRHACDALLTGIGTVLADDPRLSDRTGLPRRRPLLRVVLDSRLRMPLKSKLVRAARGDLLVFTTRSDNSPRGQALRRAGVEVARVRARAGRPDLRAVLEELGRREILSVMIEPGAALAHSAAADAVVDKLVLFIAPRMMGAGGIGISPGELLRTDTGKSFPMTSRRCGPDIIMEGYLRDVYRNR